MGGGCLKRAGAILKWFVCPGERIKTANGTALEMAPVQQHWRPPSLFGIASHLSVKAPFARLSIAKIELEIVGRECFWQRDGAGSRAPVGSSGQVRLVGGVCGALSLEAKV